MKKKKVPLPGAEAFYCDPAGQRSGDRKKRAAAYCRVSTLLEEQELSFTSQVSYYTELIARDPALTLVGIYADLGFSGLDMSGRKEFQQMLADCEAGLIDVVFCKSVSRFSRNAADTLAVLKKLKELGVRVLFEKEGLDSADPSTELILNIYTTIAQNESCSTSENTKWAYMRKAQTGNPSRGACFGYRIKMKKDDPFRYWVICEEEAKIVRRAFLMAYQGYSLVEIGLACSKATDGILFWLHNVAYRGDILTHQHVQLDYTSKKKVRNTGQRDQVYIEGHHEPIVDPAVFDEVQAIMAAGALNSRCKKKRQEWLSDHPEILRRRETGTGNWKGPHAVTTGSL